LLFFTGFAVGFIVLCLQSLIVSDFHGTCFNHRVKLTVSPRLEPRSNDPTTGASAEESSAEPSSRASCHWQHFPFSPAWLLASWSLSSRSFMFLTSLVPIAITAPNPRGVPFAPGYCKQSTYSHIRRCWIARGPRASWICQRFVYLFNRLRLSAYPPAPAAWIVYRMDALPPPKFGPTPSFQTNSGIDFAGCWLSPRRAPRIQFIEEGKNPETVQCGAFAMKRLPRALNY